MTIDPVRFAENLRLFYLVNDRNTFNIEQVDCSKIFSCTTAHGELNLQKIANNETHYYHSQEGAVAEAHSIMRHIHLAKDRAMVIYGLGLGYYYDAMKEWLKASPRNILIFLEDDLSVLHYFLQTERASEILSHPQVRLIAFQSPRKDDWGKLRADFEWLFWILAEIPYDFYCSLLNQIENRAFAQLLYGQIVMNVNDKKEFLSFYLDRYLQLDIPNLLRNIQHVDQSFDAKEIFKECQGIPSLICGAGPSLTKHLGEIRELENRALIFAAGSALNALSFHGVHTHFAAGVDSQKTTVSRYLTNFAFMVPLFYVDCFAPEALLIHHGLKLHVEWDCYYPIPQWFMKELFPLEKSDPVILNMSTSGFCLDLASKLGCNPLIFLGMDLAYSASKRYSEGIRHHPLDPEMEKKSLDDTSEGLIKIQGIDGKDVLTKWAWIREGSGYSEFAVNHPELSVINATSEGLPLAEISHIPFEDLFKSHFTEMYDVDNYIHACIQNISQFHPNKQEIDTVLKKWQTSLQNCHTAYAELTGENKTTAIAAEPAYLFFLETLEKTYAYKFYLEKWLNPENPEIEKKTNQFILKVINEHLTLLNELLKRPNLLEEPAGTPIDIPSVAQIPDLSNCQEKTYSYRDGSLKGKSYFVGGLLHGPSTFYSSDGKVLAQSVFIHGKREGISLQLYKEGAIYSIQEFKQGVRDGGQRYFTPQGYLQAKLHYKEGLLDGEVFLFYPNGKRKRELHFSKGKLNGVERFWDPSGTLISEVKYLDNQPVDRARRWHPNGQIAQEHVFYDTPDHYDEYEWDENGAQLKKNLYLSKELLKDYVEKSDLLKKQMEDALSKIKELQDKHGNPLKDKA